MVKEDEVIMIWLEHRDKSLEDCTLSLLGRFHTTKLINFKAAKNLLHSIWKIGNDLKLQMLVMGCFSLNSRWKVN